MIACSANALLNTEIQPDCLAAFYDLERIGLILGLISICWHSKLSDKLHNPYLRLSGYSDYLAVQVFTLSMRSLLWWNLEREHRSHIWGGVPTSALHATFLILTVVSTLVGAQRVQIKRTAVDFLKRSPSTVLLADDQLTPIPHQKPETFKPPTHLPSTFPISKLTTPYDAPEPDLDLGYASASETDPDDTQSIATTTTQDEMDWTPIQPARAIAPRRPIPAPPSPYNLRSSQRTPFHGTLPPAPQPPAHRALKPRAGPVFAAPSERRKENFFAQVMGGGGGGGGAHGFGGRQARRADYGMREGRLRVLEGDTVTGLEGLFSSSFQIGDDLGAGEGVGRTAGEESVVVVDERVGRQDFAFWIQVCGVLVLVGCILGVANVISPGFYGSIARGLAYVWRS